MRNTDNDLPKILTIAPETWAKSRDRELKDYEFVELDSHEAPWINGPSFEKKVDSVFVKGGSLRPSVKELILNVRTQAHSLGCEAIVGYTPAIQQGHVTQTYLFGEDSYTPTVEHFRATGMRLRE
ncbi:hypothetical protein HN747_01225 [archaeon]|jgi:hypothetical protein|nr:hypothetical protein [archaeon]